MAVFNFSKVNSGIDLTALGSIFDVTGSYAGTSSQYFFTPTTTTGTSYYSVTARGTGLTYDSAGIPNGGTVTRLTIVWHANGEGGSDVTQVVADIPGLSLWPDLRHSPGGFLPSLFNGDDRIVGSAFDDTLYGGNGSDTINGGAGSDTVSFAGQQNVSGHYSWGIGVDLEVGTVTIQHQYPYATTIETDKLVSIENIIGTDAQITFSGGSVGSGGDSLMGSAGANSIWGMGGNDHIEGRSGNDLLNGGLGDDYIDGGDGIDTVDYGASGAGGFNAGTGVTVDLATGQATGQLGSDVLVGIENVSGSSGDDRILGNAIANKLVGNAGDDVIRGRAGNDLINGGGGDDRLYGDGGNDTVASGTGNDTVFGGSGDDTLVDSTPASQAGQWSELYGETGNDRLVASGLGSTGMWGGDGGDTLVFGAGTVYALGGEGADTYTIGSDAQAGQGENFAQVFDFEIGIDHIQAGGSVSVEDWGADTGVLIVDASGVTHTIMLMGVTSDQLTSSNWLINH